jgi:hypothetical protein
MPYALHRRRESESCAGLGHKYLPGCRDQYGPGPHVTAASAAAGTAAAVLHARASWIALPMDAISLDSALSGIEGGAGTADSYPFHHYRLRFPSLTGSQCLPCQVTTLLI